jgi:endonuclease/exonuclease/phosphatase family metal-dependent hydrolase
MRLSVATYNVHGCADLARTTAVLRALDADVIALQELRWRPWDALHVLDELAARLGYAPSPAPRCSGPMGTTATRC